MQESRHVWAIVLAAGDGVRIGPLARDADGSRVPKQFCTFDGRNSMVRWAVDRAARVVSKRRIVAVVARKHRKWWQKELSELPPSNVVVQPSNRGTAVGLLLPLLEIVRRDRHAGLVILPSDHYVADEAVLSPAIDTAIRMMQQGSRRLFLLGVEPADAASEYGWIVPVGPPGLVQDVASFVEKPSRKTASELRRQGALLNSFILVGTGRTFLDMYARFAPRTLERVGRWRDVAPQPPEIEDVYRNMPYGDFSSEILQRCCGFSAVVRVPECGWMDIGTPQRLGAFRQQQDGDRGAPAGRAKPALGVLDAAKRLG